MAPFVVEAWFAVEGKLEVIMNRAEAVAASLLAVATLAGPVPSSGYADEPPPEAEAARSEHQERMRALSPFSLVPAPVGVEVKRSGSGESDRTYRYWRAKAEGSISPLELVEHYTAGLQALGWSCRPAIAEGAVVLRTGEYRDPEDATWHVLVLAAPSLAKPGRCLITFHLTQVAQA